MTGGDGSPPAGNPSGQPQRYKYALQQQPVRSTAMHGTAELCCCSCYILTVGRDLEITDARRPASMPGSERHVFFSKRGARRGCPRGSDDAVLKVGRHFQGTVGWVFALL